MNKNFSRYILPIANVLIAPLSDKFRIQSRDFLAYLFARFANTHQKDNISRLRAFFDNIFMCARNLKSADINPLLRYALIFGRLKSNNKNLLIRGRLSCFYRGLIIFFNKNARFFACKFLVASKKSPCTAKSTSLISYKNARHKNPAKCFRLFL